VIIGLDAPLPKKTGVVLEKPANLREGVMAFLLMPLDLDLPNVIAHLHPTATMKLDPAVKQGAVLQIISAAGFETVGVGCKGSFRHERVAQGPGCGVSGSACRGHAPGN
jgi:hypothetical protein